MSSTIGVLAEYLRARRGQLTPDEVGLVHDPRRRVRGLRRSEVAELAGISVQYYTRLEQGRTRQPSEIVLAGLVRALALDDHAAEYFYRLALPVPPVTRAAAPGVVADDLTRLVGLWPDLPVVLYDRNQDVVLSNDLAHALLPTCVVAGSNAVETVVGVPAEGRGLEGWKNLARQAVAALRFHSDPTDPRLHEIVGALSIRDADFRRLWADHQARPLESGRAPVLVDGVGFGEIPWQTLEVPGGYFLVVYLAIPGEFSGVAIGHLRDIEGSHVGLAA